MNLSPGPWKVSDMDRRAIVGADDLVIADVVNWRETNDAQLIAAAPDLLAFAKDFLKSWTAPGPTDSPLEAQARAAIAKADFFVYRSPR